MYCSSFQAQKYLLGGIEKLIEMKRDALLPKVAVIFKTLYDEDILDEEVRINTFKAEALRMHSTF